MSNKINIIEYQLPHNFVKYSFLTWHFLSIMIYYEYLTISQKSFSHAGHCKIHDRFTFLVFITGRLWFSSQYISTSLTHVTYVRPFDVFQILNFLISGHGPQTGLCVPSDRMKNMTVCQISSWCPVEDDRLLLGKERLEWLYFLDLDLVSKIQFILI